MALTHWTFLYAASGLPQEGRVDEVVTESSTTVLAGFPTAQAALAASADGSLARHLAGTQLVELCGAFSHEHVATLQAAHPGTPLGLVTYAGGAASPLHAIFG